MDFQTVKAIIKHSVGNDLIFALILALVLYWQLIVSYKRLHHLAVSYVPRVYLSDGNWLERSVDIFRTLTGGFEIVTKGYKLVLHLIDLCQCG